MLKLALSAFLLLAPAVAFAQQAAPAQQPTPSPPRQQQHWIQSETQIASRTARIGFPRTAGPVSIVGNREYSNRGLGIDDSLTYRSADEAVVATVYLYYPGLPHSGLAAYATDTGIRGTSPTPVRASPPRLVAAGGVPNAAIRIDYENYRNMDSAAAFIKAGRWIVKIRVSAPLGRRADVDAAISALLQGIVFGPASPAFAATPLTISNCPAGTGERAATLLLDPPGAEIAAHAMLGTFDGGGNLATNENGARQDLPSRVPPELCLSRIAELGGNRIPILRAADGAPLSVDGRTRLLAVISDSGMVLEVVHAANLGRYIMLYHQIGSTALLGGYDAVPSDQQIIDLLSNPQSDAGRIRVPIVLRPNQGPQMQLPGPAMEARPSS